MESPSFDSRTWEPGEIHRALRQLPATIAKQSQKVIEADAEIREIEHLIELQRAAVKVEHVGKKLTATEINAIAYPKTDMLVREVNKRRQNRELEQARLEYFRALFDSCRKAASLRIEEMRRLEGTVSNRTFRQQ